MQHIIRHLFKTDSLEEVPRERLEELVQEYPSFSMARYLLSRKLRAEDAARFAEETQKTNLYFTNPFWLQWLLRDEGEEKGASIAKPERMAETPAVPHEELAVSHEEPVITHEELPLAEESQVAQEIPAPEEVPIAQGLAVPEEIPVTEAHAIGPANEPMPAGEPIFSSYHTIDYFASLGIKFKPEENPSDKLGKQLKSFTDWLKVMKRLPQKNMETVPDIAAEHKIQAIAAHSIEGKEILTETMAEVLAMQGMREKASEVYLKLSLLDPDKSAYFAAKIEQLKTN